MLSNKPPFIWESNNINVKRIAWGTIQAGYSHAC